MGFACVCLTQHSRSGIMAWWQERLNGRGSISSHYAHTSSLRLTVGWCWRRDAGLLLKNIVSQCGGGDTHQWKTLFTDGPLNKPTASKQCSYWAVWGIMEIMCFNCLPFGRCSDLKDCGQISLVFVVPNSIMCRFCHPNLGNVLSRIVFLLPLIVD